MSDLVQKLRRTGGEISFIHEAADRIEELEVENKRLRAERRWIPVTERLPEWHRTVLVPGGAAHFEGDAWYSHESKQWREIQWEVTHWQPLPEPPEGPSDE